MKRGAERIKENILFTAMNLSAAGDSEMEKHTRDSSSIQNKPSLSPKAAHKNDFIHSSADAQTHKFPSGQRKTGKHQPPAERIYVQNLYQDQENQIFDILQNIFHSEASLASWKGFCMLWDRAGCQLLWREDRKTGGEKSAWRDGMNKYVLGVPTERRLFTSRWRDWQPRQRCNEAASPARPNSMNQSREEQVIVYYLS